MSTLPALDGELSFARVPHWLAQADALAGAGTLDLSKVTGADSAGLALLLELSRRARAKGLALHLKSPPQQLSDLIRFFGLDEVLHFEPSSSH
jgi:phospholipid transport system transporter-binding protein